MVNSLRIEDNSKEYIKRKDEIIEAALYEVGMFLADQASKQLEATPRRVDTGRLRNSLAFATDEGSGTAATPMQGGDGSPHGRPGKESVAWGTNVEYAEYVHEGTSRMAPNRFIKNSWTLNKDQIERKLKNALQQG